MSGLTQDRQNALMKSVYLLRAKARNRNIAFSCFLDEQPSPLVPRRPGRPLVAPPDDAPLVVNPRFRYQAAGDPPAEIGELRLPLNGFLRGYPLAWVYDPGPGLWMAFWVREAWADVLAALRPGDQAPSSLPPAVRRTLGLAQVLVSPDHEERQRATWDATCQAARAQFQAKGYTVVRDLLHPFQVGALRQYYRTLLAEGDVPLGDPQVPDRYRLHSEVIASFYHVQLVDLVGRIAGQAAKPSYVYFASYQPGAELKPHTDREQCELSISLLVDYAPEPEGQCAWPLYLEDPRAPGEVAAADLGIGDAVFYRGCDLIHYRHPLRDAERSTSYFLHYVPADYAGQLW